MIMGSMIQEIEQFSKKRSTVLAFPTEKDIVDELALTT